MMKSIVLAGLALSLVGTPVLAVPKHRVALKHHSVKPLTLAQRKQIYLHLTQTEYLAAKRFPGPIADPRPKDAYQDRLIAGVERRFGITKSQGDAISDEGSAKMWPIMGANGEIDHIH